MPISVVQTRWATVRSASSRRAAQYRGATIDTAAVRWAPTSSSSKVSPFHAYVGNLRPARLFIHRVTVDLARLNDGSPDGSCKTTWLIGRTFASRCLNCTANGARVANGEVIACPFFKWMRERSQLLL